MRALPFRFASLALLAALPAAAQQSPPKSPAPPKPAPVIRGAIQDLLGNPLEGGQVEIVGLGLRATTSATGAYRIEEIRPGRYWVVARRIGYSALHAALTFAPGDDREVVFQLDPLPQLLPDLETKEDRIWARRMADFTWRSRSSFGHFLTRDDIEKEHPNYLSDVVRRYLPFVNTQSMFTASFPDPSGMMGRVPGFGSSRASAFGGAGCGPAISINGVRPMGGWAVNDFRPEDVEAVEVYRTAHQMPIEFQDWGVGGCGLVVVWLR